MDEKNDINEIVIPIQKTGAYISEKAANDQAQAEIEFTDEGEDM